jgi:hypothetical protein
MLCATGVAAAWALAAGASAQVECSRTKISVTGCDVATTEVSSHAPQSRSGPVASPAGVAWSFSDNNAGWIGTAVSLGDHGTQVFTELHKNAQAAVLLSAFDTDPATAIWSHPSPGTDARKVASADAIDLHVVAHEQVLGLLRRVEVEAFRSSSGAPQWSYAFDPLIAGGSDIGISRDGQHVVAAIDNAAAGRIECAVLDGSSGALQSYTTIPVTGAMHGFDLSADGSTLLLTADTTAFVFDVATASVVFSDDVSTSLDAVGISGDGRVLAFGGFNWMRVWERGAGPVWALTYTRYVPGVNYVGALDVSDDGSTIAYGFNFYDLFLSVRVEAFDVAAKVMTMNELVTGLGALQNVISDVALSADGSRFAVGMWGDALDTVRELRYYARDSNAPIDTVDMPGSVYDVAISPDGRRVAAAGKAIHANTLGNGGSVVLYDAGSGDFALEGRPQLGSSPTFKVYGAPGHVALLLVAEGALATPMPLFSGGLLHLDRDRTDVFPMGLVSQTGCAAQPFSIPAAPNLAGVTLYFQGLTTGPRALTHDWLQVTILP